MKHLLAPDKRAAKGTFDRKRAIRESSTPLFAFGHETIDLLLRSALAPDSEGGAAIAQFSPDRITNSATVNVLIRQEEHAGSSAYRLVTVECRKDLTCLLAEQTYPNNLKASNILPTHLDTAQLKQTVTDFLTEQFPEIDFIEDKLYWLSVCIFDPHVASRVTPGDSDFVQTSRAWIRTQLGSGSWEAIAEEVSNRLSGDNAVIDLAQIEEIAATLNVKPLDVHAVLTSLTSHPDGFVARQFYRAKEGSHIEVPHEEVARQLEQRDRSPVQWRVWAEEVGVAWRRSKTK